MPWTGNDTYQQLVADSPEEKAPCDPTKRGVNSPQGVAPKAQELVRRAPCTPRLASLIYVTRNDAPTDWSWIEIPRPSALIVVDAQAGFVGPHTGHVESQISALLTQRGKDFDVVVATQFVNPADSNFRRLIDWHLLDTPEQTRLFDSVASHASVVLEKSTYGASQQLGAILDSHQVEDVFLCGIDTDVCVLQNAAGLFDLGYSVRVIVEACGTNGGPDAQNSATILLTRTIGYRQTLLRTENG